MAGQMEVGFEEKLARRRASSHAFLRSLHYVSHLREVYVRETFFILEWPSCLWRQGEPKDLFIWRSDYLLLAQVDLISRDAWR